MIVSVSLTLAFIILQSTVLANLAVLTVIPDVALILIVYVSNRYGSLYGQVGGFGAGVLRDVLSSAPLGFFALVYTPIAFVAGLTHNRVFTDAIFMPSLFIVVATLMKGLIVLLTGLIWGLEDPVNSVVNFRFLIELGLNAIIAPALFALADLLAKLTASRRPSRGF